MIPQAPDGAADNRVILVDPAGRIVWQYGQFGQTGSGPNLLNTPVQCTWLPNFHVLITDQANNRIIEVNLRKENRLAVSGFEHQRRRPAQQPELRRTARKRPYPDRRPEQQPGD